MTNKNEEQKGFGSGPGVDPIPVPEHPTSSTDMLEDIVEAMWNDSKAESGQTENQTDSTDRKKNNK